MSDILLEVCVEDAAGLAAAVEGGADRVELCSALAVGGLTPSIGLMRLAACCTIPVYAMIRPRAGDFVFRSNEIAIMLEDIDAARSAGLSGVVLGASLADGGLDRAALGVLATRAAGLGLTLHRAFDLVPNFVSAMEIAIDLGFERILTSGGAKAAPGAIATLARIVAAADRRISIMPGSGVTPENVDQLLSQLSVMEVHSSCSVDEPACDLRLVLLGFVPPTSRRTDAATVRALKARLASAP